MKFKIWEMALMTALAVTMLCGFVWQADGQEMADKMIRIHVVANSDSAEDQALKLSVRDAVLDSLESILAGAEDKTAAEKRVEAALEALRQTAENEVRRQGYTYTVTAVLTEESFPTRDYDTFSLPAGRYTSLRIVLGAGEGHNWWCVVYPALCTAAAVEDSEAAETLSPEEIGLITEENTGYVIKFKTIEWMNGLRAFLFG